MLARHLIVSVEYRTLYRMKDSNAAYTSHKWSLPTTTSSTHHSLVQQYSNAQWLALSNGIGHCPSDHHPAVLPRRLSCVAVHNDGPTRMKADNASVHHPVVLDSRSSINSAVSGLERLRARSTGGGYCLCLLFSSAHPAFQLYRALNNCGPALMKEDVAYAHHPAAR